MRHLTGTPTQKKTFILGLCSDFVNFSFLPSLVDVVLTWVMGQFVHNYMWYTVIWMFLCGSYQNIFASKLHQSSNRIFWPYKSKTIQKLIVLLHVLMYCCFAYGAWWLRFWGCCKPCALPHGMHFNVFFTMCKSTHGVISYFRAHGRSCVQSLQSCGWWQIAHLIYLVGTLEACWQKNVKYWRPGIVIVWDVLWQSFSTQHLFVVFFQLPLSMASMYIDRSIYTP